MLPASVFMCMFCFGFFLLTTNLNISYLVSFLFLFFSSVSFLHPDNTVRLWKATRICHSKWRTLTVSSKAWTASWPTGFRFTLISASKCFHFLLLLNISCCTGHFRLEVLFFLFVLVGSCLLAANITLTACWLREGTVGKWRLTTRMRLWPSL